MNSRALLLALWLVAPAAAQIAVTQKPDMVDIRFAGSPPMHFVYGAGVMKPYLYPLFAPDGTRVSRMFPMEKVAGESTDHPHQRSLWFAHASVNGIDFWNNEASYTTKNRGRISVQRISRAKGGKTGEVDADLEWLDPAGTPLLREARKMTFSQEGGDHVMDFDFTLTAITRATFGDEKDGIFGIRVAPELEGPHKGAPSEPQRSLVMNNADGLTSEKQVWGKRSNWVDYSGDFPKGKEGIAIFDHPANFRHPTYWHSREYGLFAVNPFAERAFTGDKSKDGSYTLEPGQQLRLRYRVVIHPGDAASAHIAELYRAYAR